MSSGDWWVLSIGILSGLLGMFLSYYSLSKWDLSETVPLTTIGPVVTALIAYVMLGETLSVLGYLGVVIVVISIFTLQFFENSLNLRTFCRNLLSSKLVAMFTTTLLFSISQIAYKGVSDSISSTTYLLFGYSVSIVVCLCILVLGEKKPVKELFHFDLGFLGLSLVAVIAVHFNFWAYRTASAVLVSSVQQIQVLLLITAGFLFLKERANIKIRFVTGTLAVVGISIMSWFG